MYGAIEYKPKVKVRVGVLTKYLAWKEIVTRFGANVCTQDYVEVFDAEWEYWTTKERAEEREKELAESRQNNFKITTTPIEIFKAGGWEKYCEKTGVDLYVVSEGNMAQDEPLQLSLELAEEIGLFSKTNTPYTHSRVGWGLS